MGEVSLYHIIYTYTFDWLTFMNLPVRKASKNFIAVYVNFFVFVQLFKLKYNEKRKINKETFLETQSVFGMSFMHCVNLK